MKRFSSRSLASSLPTGVRAGIALLLGVGVFAGCGRKPLVADAPTIPAATETAPAPMPANQPVYVPPAAPATIAAGTDGGADLKQLNHSYIGWIVQNHRRPKTFEEFVTLSGTKVPPAPAGKKYVIEKSGFINLVSQ